MRELLDGISLESFEADWQRQWLVERGLEIISEASRHLPPELKERHRHIPWKKVAGIGNYPAVRLWKRRTASNLGAS